MNQSSSSASGMNASVAARVISLVRTKPETVFLRTLDAKMNAEEMTYRDFFTHALITSSLYDRFQVPVSGTVILVLSNPKDVFIAEAGALLTGRKPIVSAHPSSKLSLNDFGRTLLPLIANAEPSLIVGDPAFCSYLSAAIGRRVASFDDIVTPKALPKVGITDDPVLFIQYSSGTTGTKKGVTISNEQLLWQIDAYAREIGLGPNDHIVSWLPYYHDMGLLTSLMTPLLTGTPITVMSPFDWVKNPLMLLRAISKYRGTLTWLPNFAYNFLAQAAQRGDLSGIDLSSLRGVVNCSEPISAGSHEAFLKAFAPQGFKADALAASYAMAETTFAITSGGFGRPMRIDHIDRTKLAPGAHVEAGPYAAVSSGHILAGTDVKIFGPDLAVLGERHIGQIGVHSPSLMGGYFKNPQANAEAYAGRHFLTGDLGYLDSGELFVTGRIKDLIITAGRNIYPQDIEAVVNDLPDVAPGRCVAFGLADEVRGTEQVVVIVELAESAASPADVKNAIATAITRRFDISLADVMIADAGWLRKSTSGKIARGQNRDRYLDMKRATQEHTIDRSTPAGIIRGCIHQVTGAWVEDADAPLITAGVVDSLALTNLLLALEDEFKKELPAPDEVGFDAFDSINAIAAIIAADRQKPRAKAFDLVIDRQIKANYVLEGPRDFDSLIMGSSRSYLIRAAHAARYGLRAFQFSVAGSRIEELYCIARFFSQTNRTPLKHIILGTDPIQFAPHLPIDMRLEKSPMLYALLDAADREARAGLQKDDMDPDERTESFAMRLRVRYGAWDLDHAFDQKTGDILKLFDKTIATMQPLNCTSDVLAKKWAEQYMVARDIDALHPRRLYYYDKLLRLTEELGCKLTIFTNPLHPYFIEKLGAETPYLRTQDALIDHLKKTAHSGVTVHRFITPSDYGGIDVDYYDGVHMGRHNGDRLLDHILRSA